MYRRMKKLGIAFCLLCSVLYPCSAQLRADVGPGDGPVDPGMHVAKVGTTLYSSLPAAIKAVNAADVDKETIFFLNRVSLSETDPIHIAKTTTFDLNGLSLTCASGTRFEVAADKMLVLDNGIYSGSFHFSGQLFAGENAVVKDCSVMAGSGSGQKNVYRILVRLPGVESEGSVFNVEYGGTQVSYFARQGDVLCCWIQQSVAARALTFSYSPTGKSPVNYITDPLTVILHAESWVGSKVDASSDGDVSVAEVVIGGGAAIPCKTLITAFDTLKDATDPATIKLLTSCKLNQVAKAGVPLVLDLNGCVLTSEGTAGFAKAANGSLKMVNSRLGVGNMSGLFSVEPGIIMDKTVLLPASITLDGRQVYRTRVKLPTGTTAATFSYADVTNRPATVLTEEGETVAYPWLPAHTADKLIVSITSGSTPVVQQTKYDITIQANHDNVVDLTKGEVEAILKRPGQADASFESFHEALNAAIETNGSRLELQRNVQFAHSDTDLHAVKAGITTELSLNGFTLNAGNSVLDASATGSCLFITDARGTGRITGTFHIKGNIYIDKEIMAGNIGVVQDTDSKLLYRVLVDIDVEDNGPAAYLFGSIITSPKACYVKDKTACIWLPGAAYGTLTMKKGADTFIAKEVRISATHSNTVAVARPGVVARIGDTPYTSLSAAFAAAKDKEVVSLTTNATLDEVLTTATEAAITFDLGTSTLTGKDIAAFRPATGSTLHIRGGSAAGILDVTEAVTIDRSTLLTTAVTSGGRQVYRTRLLLAADDKGKGKELSYTYATLTAGLPLVLEEGTDPLSVVAYCWLPARPASPFVLKVDDTSRTRGEVAIQANHDNNIDLTKGDIEAILYKEGEDPNDPALGIRYETFHNALDAAGGLSGSSIWLQRDVQFSGDQHTIGEGVVTELCLRGHNLTAVNSILDASEEDACLVVSDAKLGTGRITGTFRILGNVYIGKDVVAGNIGPVLNAETGTQLYRTLVRIETPMEITDGTFGSYSLGTGLHGKCYLQDMTAVIWLPVGIVPETLTLVVGGNTYTAKGVQAIAAHSNTFIVRDPAVIAMVGETSYTSLADAFASAVGNETVVLKQSTTLSAPILIGKALHLKLDLGEYTLTFQDKGAFVSEADASLAIRSSSEQGILSGNPSFTGAVCVSGSVSMSGLVSLTVGGTTATVYRCRLYLPKGAASGTYSYGGQSGMLRLIGEKNTIEQPIAYAWLRSETGTRDLTVTLDAPLSGTRTLTDVLIQATHNNQFDMEASDNVARVGDQYYPSLKTAIDAVNAGGGGTLILVIDQTLRGMQSVTSAIRFDLNGKKLSLTADAGFDVKGSNTLLITDDNGNADANKGYLYGTMQINGGVYVDAKVRLSGTVVRNGVEVQRLSVDKLPVTQNLQTVRYTYAASGDKETALVLSGTACLWLPEVAYEDDLLFTASAGSIYETTLSPSLTGHNKRQDAYRLVRVDESTTWADDANKDCNVVVAPHVVLTLATEGKLKTIHRLTLCNESQLVCSERVLATGGIIYQRSFAVANRWEAFSLPFGTRSVTAVFNGEPVSLNPYLSDGTGGHFWLRSLADDGTFTYVANEQVESNKGYIIAVPAGLASGDNTDMAIRFASAPNQFLQRTALEGVPPETTGFLQLAGGTLCNQPMTQPFYLLNTEGTEYVRQSATDAKPVALPPFSSYLLADKETVETVATLRLGGVATGNETLMPPATDDVLKVYGSQGGILAVADKEQVLSVYTLQGRLCICQRIPEGRTFIALPSGIYVANREKVFVTK